MRLKLTVTMAAAQFGDETEELPPRSSTDKAAPKLATSTPGPRPRDDAD
jgi:hypothetical protein